MINRQTNVKMSVFDYMRAYRDENGSVALVQGCRKMTFETLFGRVDALAARLQKAGIKAGDVVAVALPNILQNAVAFYALSRLGATAFEIHPKVSKQQFEKEIETVKPKMVLLSEINFGRLHSRCNGAKVVYCPFGAYGFVGLPHTSKQVEVFEGDGEETAVLMHSGGTSGEPKIVALSSRALNALVKNLFASLDDKFDNTDAMLTAIPLFHGFGLGVGVHCALSTRMKVVLMPIFSPEKVLKTIEKEKITTFIAIPRMLFKLMKSRKATGKRLSTLKEIYVGGDSLDENLRHEFDALLKKSGSSARVSPGYGLSETCSVCALQRDNFKPDSLGRPLDGVRVKIVDENGVELKNGQIGELLIGSEQNMSGYYLDQTASQNAYATVDGEKWLKTGDLAEQDGEGFLYFKGRKKRLVKISGMNVFPSEIERVAKTCKSVSECVAFQTKTDSKSYVTLAVEGQLTDQQKDEIKSKISDELSHWSQPKEIICVDELPRTQMGKPDYKRVENEYKENRK